MAITVNTTEKNVIVRLHVTEKSGILSQNGKYTFIIANGANKKSIANSVKSLYKVTPEHITTINISSRSVLVRGRRGVTSGFRKAVVTLKKGETINFV